MKKRIGTRNYNTDTAKLIGSYDNGLITWDCHYYMEQLYRKRNGEYFLYGEGGAASKYCENEDNIYRSGEEIIPITNIDAIYWKADYLKKERNA